MALYEDKIVFSPAQDELGRQRIVDLIVNAIKAKVQESHKALTFGIYGAWGEGKTSTMRMVEHQLKLNGVSCQWFNPWSFSGERRMVSELFGSLASLAFSDSSIGRLLPSYRDAFIPLEGPLANPALAEYQASLAKCLPFDGNDLQRIKETISQRLDQENHHLVVFIDDVDRLDTCEVQVIFKMIRQVVDFSNVIYVIGLDPDVVSLQLGNLYGDNNQARGRDFLEKIINVPIVLPEVQDALLDSIIRKEVVGVWKENNLAVDEKQEDLVVMNLLPVLKTKRAIDRFANQLSFIVPTIGIETELVDLCLVEILKYLDEKGWSEIYHQRKGLLKEGIHLLSGKDKEDEEKRVFSDAVSKVAVHFADNYQSYVKMILEKHLFAKSHQYQTNNLSKCINNPKFFHQYFISGIPEVTIPRAVAIEFSELLMHNSEESIDWINKNLVRFSSYEVDRSACLSLDLIKDFSSSEVAARLSTVLAFSDLAKDFGFNTIGNPSTVDATIYAHIIPHYMVTRSPERRRIHDMNTEEEVLSDIFDKAPLNFCMSLFTGVYENDRIRPPKESRVFDIIKNRLFNEGQQTILKYSYPIKKRFFLIWKEASYSEYQNFWKEVLSDQGFDLGFFIKEWLEAASPQDQLTEIDFLSEILSPAETEVRKNLLRSNYVHNKLTKFFIWNSGLFTKQVTNDNESTKTIDNMSGISIYETSFPGIGGKRVKMAIFRFEAPVTDLGIIKTSMDEVVHAYVQGAIHNTFIEEHADNPNMRIVISEINDVDFHSFNGEHL